MSWERPEKFSGSRRERRLRNAREVWVWDRAAVVRFVRVAVVASSTVARRAGRSVGMGIVLICVSGVSEELYGSGRGQGRLRC